jgi:hypothetical protein
MGREVAVAITDGRFDDSAELVEVSGPWERIFYCEFDVRRRKRVLIKIIGEQVAADHGQPALFVVLGQALNLSMRIPFDRPSVT